MAGERGEKERGERVSKLEKCGPDLPERRRGGGELRREQWAEEGRFGAHSVWSAQIGIRPTAATGRKCASKKNRPIRDRWAAIPSLFRPPPPLPRSC